jgi:hypothetical protein
MASLYHSDGAAAGTWVYCILWWFVQDAAKMLTYEVLDYFKPAAEKEVETFARRHSAEYLDKAPADAAVPATVPASGDLLPQGTDLTAIAKAAAATAAPGADAAKAPATSTGSSEAV